MRQIRGRCEMDAALLAAGCSRCGEVAMFLRGMYLEAERRGASVVREIRHRLPKRRGFHATEIILEIE